MSRSRDSIIPPGMMVYTDVVDAMMGIDGFGHTEIGRYICAWRDSLKTGAEPEFDDSPVLKIVWAMQRPRREADMRHYQDQVIHSWYMAYCKACKARHIHPLESDAWEEAGMPTGRASEDEQEDCTEEYEDALPFEG